MLKAQQSLIAHLTVEFPSTTLKEYAGEVSDANKLCEVLPAVLVFYAGGDPMAQEPTHIFDILVMTESDILDKEEAKNNNLDLLSQVNQYLRDNYTFLPHDSSTGSYAIDKELVQARTILQTNQITIIALNVSITDYTYR